MGRIREGVGVGRASVAMRSQRFALPAAALTLLLVVVTAALFLKRFVKKAKAYTHFDMFAWTASARPGQPKGGEVQVARALFEVIRKRAEG